MHHSVGALASMNVASSTPGYLPHPAPPAARGLPCRPLPGRSGHGDGCITPRSLSLTAEVSPWSRRKAGRASQCDCRRDSATTPKASQPRLSRARAIQAGRTGRALSPPCLPSGSWPAAELPFANIGSWPSRASRRCDGDRSVWAANRSAGGRSRKRSCNSQVEPSSWAALTATMGYSGRVRQEKL